MIDPRNQSGAQRFFSQLLGGFSKVAANAPAQIQQAKELERQRKRQDLLDLLRSEQLQAAHENRVMARQKFQSNIDTNLADKTAVAGELLRRQASADALLPSTQPAQISVNPAAVSGLTQQSLPNLQDKLKFLRGASERQSVRKRRAVLNQQTISNTKRNNRLDALREISTLAGVQFKKAQTAALNKKSGKVVAPSIDTQIKEARNRIREQAASIASQIGVDKANFDSQGRLKPGAFKILADKLSKGEMKLGTHKIGGMIEFGGNPSDTLSKLYDQFILFGTPSGRQAFSDGIKNASSGEIGQDGLTDKEREELKRLENDPELK